MYLCGPAYLLSNITRSRHVSTIYVANMSIKMVPSYDSNVEGQNIKMMH